MPKQKKRTVKPPAAARTTTKPLSAPAWVTAALHSWYGKLFGLWLVGWLILMSFLFSEFLRHENYLEIFPSWLVLPAAIHALSVLVAAVIIYLLPIPKRYSAKLLAAMVTSLLLVNYDTRLTEFADVARPFVPLLPSPGSGGDMAALSLIFMALAITIVVLVCRWFERFYSKYPQLTGVNVAAGVLVLSSFVFVSQAARAIPVLWTVSSQYGIELPALPSTKASEEKPDIYYIVLDRYANAGVLKDQMNFDNSEFIKGLRAKGFTVNENAYSNYPFTSPSVASTLTADYTNSLSDPFKGDDIQSRVLYHRLTQESVVARTLKQQGYVYHTLDFGASDQGPLADVEHMSDTSVTVFGTEKRLRGLEGTTFTQSPFYRFSNISSLSWWPVQVRGSDFGGIPTVKQLDVLNQLSRSEPGGRFIFAHILSPHPPYFFNADGSLSVAPGEDNTRRTVVDKYLNQVEFINSQMDKLVESIKENSGGKAVIIINADEGPYPPTARSDIFVGSARAEFDENVKHGDMNEWSDDWLKLKYGILQAVYIPKAGADDLSQLSSVNVFRIVFNSYFGADMPYLPQCNLAFPEGTTMHYRQTDVTGRLAGESLEFCESLVD